MDAFSVGTKLLILSQSGTKSEDSGSTVDPTDFGTCSDETLLRFVQSGDREALAWLFRRYATTIRNLGRKILRVDGEAEDLVQDVFLYVQRRCDLFQSSEGAARSWIFQVAYTQAFLRRRRLKSHGLYELPSTEKCVAAPTRGVDYDKSVEGLFGRNGWKAVLDTLSGDQREIIRLHFFEGYTFAEIAVKLGQSYVNIRHHYYRSLEKFRKHADDNDLRWP
jgi:RNA polymerase sigma-70 factor, ECF subfamily